MSIVDLTDSDEDTYSDLPPLEDDDGNLVDDGTRHPVLEVLPGGTSSSDANLHKLTTPAVPGKERSDSSEQQHPQSGTQTTANVTGAPYTMQEDCPGPNTWRSGYYFFGYFSSLQQISEVAAHKSTPVAVRYMSNSDTTRNQQTIPTP